MKALQIENYGSLRESLSFNQIDRPSCGENDLLIKTEAAGLNPIDYKLVGGNLKDMVPLEMPVTIGFDVSGVVVEAGKDVTGFTEGDEIYARVPQEQMGTVAEYVAVDHKVVSKKPDAIAFIAAAGLPLVGLTAIQALNAVNLKSGDRILIHAGSGGVGSFAIQYAKAKGAYIYTTTSTKNVTWVEALGADRVIDYKKEDYKSIATDLDVVFDTLGDKYTTEAFQLIKNGGRVTTIVGPPDEETAAAMGIQDYHMPEELAKLIEKTSAKYQLTWMQPDGEQLDEISQMVADQTIVPVVDEVYPFEKAIDAFEHLSSGHAKGKVIIRMS